MSQSASASPEGCTTPASSRPTPPSHASLRELVGQIDRALVEEAGWRGICDRVVAALPPFLADARAVPEDHLVRVPDRYARNLLYSDPQGRFVVLALVWGPGQATPIHDHESWGVVGCYKGVIAETAFATPPASAMPCLPIKLERTTYATLQPGQACWVDPPDRDLHRMENPSAGETITIHIYGREMLSCNVWCNGVKTRKHFVYDQPEPLWAKR